ncbi:unnamed protein product [Menidia menidia]|uniref:(Atlantic silverside) hypothetical protein n=1 Tax=Menidia menidia TaxID=238744 RepID=A0A8S4AIV0_9TELE|nr:unnamed protein product [Menidia menidia]
MAIVSCHPAWARRRSDLHSGAQRRYGAPPAARFPRGPSVAAAPCDACCRGNGPASSSSPASGRPPVGGVNGPFPSTVGPEKTPPPTGHAPLTGHAPSIGHAPPTGHAPSIGHAPQPPAPGRFWPEELPRDPSSCSSACDAFMDWINEM